MLKRCLSLYLRTQAVLLSFSGGAILACAFFLILIEAAHLVATGHRGANPEQATPRSLI